MKRLVVLKNENIYKLLAYDKVKGLVIYESKNDVTKMSDEGIKDLLCIKYTSNELNFINEIVTVTKTQLYNLISGKGVIGAMADFKLAIINVNKIEDYKIDKNIVTISFNVMLPSVPEIVERNVLYLEDGKSFWFVVNNTLVAFNNIRGAVIKEYL